MKEACEDIRNGSTFAAASQKYDVPEGTLRNRYHGRTQSATKSHTHQRLMDDSQEKVLVDWMMFLAMTGRPISRTTLRPKYIEICGRLPGRTCYIPIIHIFDTIDLQVTVKCSLLVQYRINNLLQGMLDSVAVMP